MPTHDSEEIDVLAERDLGPVLAFVCARQLGCLRSELRDSETLQYLAWTVPYVRAWLFALSDQRIIFIHKQLITRRCTTRAVEIADIEAIREERGVVSITTLYVLCAAGGDVGSCSHQIEEPRCDRVVPSLAPRRAQRPSAFDH